MSDKLKKLDLLIEKAIKERKSGSDSHLPSKEENLDDVIVETLRDIKKKIKK